LDGARSRADIEKRPEFFSQAKLDDGDYLGVTENDSVH
jgi:hypothetical protein